MGFLLLINRVGYQLVQDNPSLIYTYKKDVIGELDSHRHGFTAVPIFSRSRFYFFPSN